MAVSVQPAMELNSQLAFPSIGEYVTIMGYGAIGEYEVAEARASEIASTSFKLTVIEIPRAENRRYMCLIDYNNDAPVKFEIGEGIKVNFEPEVNNQAEDWSAVVVNPLPFAGVHQTSVVLVNGKVSKSMERPRG